MAISYVDAGAVAWSSSGGTTISPAYPTGAATTGNILILFVGFKPATYPANPTNPTPDGWTHIVTRQSYNYTSVGGDTGNMWLSAYYREVGVPLFGSETVNLTGSNIAWAKIVAYSRDASEDWEVGYSGLQHPPGSQEYHYPTKLSGGAWLAEAGDHYVGALTIPSDAPEIFTSYISLWTYVLRSAFTQIEWFSTRTGNDAGGALERGNVNSVSTTPPGSYLILSTSMNPTTNGTGPYVMVYLRAKLGTQTVTYVSTGGAVAGGAAAKSRTVRGVSTGGAVAGGVATVATGQINFVDYASQGGAISGGMCSVKIGRAFRSGDGAVAGGQALLGQVAVRLSTGGAVAGGSGEIKRLFPHTSAGGAVAAGSAVTKSTRKAWVTGGAVAAGSAGVGRTVIQINSMRSSGGAVAGGAALVEQILLQIIEALSTGGAIAGGSANIDRTIVQVLAYLSQGGAVAGGEALVAKLVTALSSGGAVAGGEALVNRTIVQIIGHLSGGGAVAGGSTLQSRGFTFFSTGGAIAGGQVRIDGSFFPSLESRYQFSRAMMGGFPVVHASVSAAKQRAAVPQAGRGQLRLPFKKRIV